MSDSLQELKDLMNRAVGKKPPTVTPIGEGALQINVECVSCRKEYSVTVRKEGFDAWKAGKHIQYALPELTPGLRELLLSQTCEACFDRMWSDE